MDDEAPYEYVLEDPYPEPAVAAAPPNGSKGLPDMRSALRSLRCDNDRK